MNGRLRFAYHAQLTFLDMKYAYTTKLYESFKIYLNNTIDKVIFMNFSISPSTRLHKPPRSRYCQKLWISIQIKKLSL